MINFIDIFSLSISWFANDFYDNMWLQFIKNLLRPSYSPLIYF